MITGHTPESLRAFEDQIAADFNEGKIRAPIHLAGGGEELLIEIFQEIQPQDWIFTAWRSHYHALLKGVSPERLRQDILRGRSITLCYSDHRVFSTAILGGQFSIALGTALAIAQRRDAVQQAYERSYDHILEAEDAEAAVRGALAAHASDSMLMLGGLLSEIPERVWVFAGDMTCRTGAFHEAVEYASGHSLPIIFVMEDNGRSVCTDTRRAWGVDNTPIKAIAYSYVARWPHSGTGKWIEF